jgi:hypothetical protein
MLRQRLSTTYGRLLLLVTSILVTLACTSGEALAQVPVNGPGGWQTGPFYVTVTDGYSYNNGASMSCSGSNGAYETYYGAGPNSGGVLMEQQWYVPNNGATTINCSVENSNHTASDSGSGTFYMDNVTPSVGVNVNGGAGANGWYYSAPGFSAALYGYGPSGISSTGCSGIYQQGANSITCSATSGSGITGYGGTTIYYDSYTPYVNTSISGGSQANGWYSTAPSISPSPYNVGPSGVWYDSCTGLSNGVNAVTCSVTDVNGLGSTDGATTVKLDNQTPSNSLPASTGTWYTSTSSIPTLTVGASEGTNYSGLTALSCSNPNDGSSGNYTLTQGVSTSASIQGTYPVADLAIGTNNISCTSTTGAGATTTSSFTVLYDPQTPTVQISTTADSTAWYPSVSSIPGLVTSGTLGTSGVKSFTCSGDGIGTQNYANNTGGTVSLAGLNAGAGTVTCTLTANNGLSATATKNLKLDTTTPAVTWASTSNAWTTAASQTLQVDVGPSGLASVACDDNSSAVSVTAGSSNPSSGAGTYYFTVATAAQGPNVMSCAAVNGDTGSALTGNSPAQTFNVDNSSPLLTITTSGSQTQWYTSLGSIPQLSVATTIGASGIQSFGCSGDGITAQTWSSISGGAISLTGLNQGSGTVTCTVTSNSGETSYATFDLNLDTTAPAVAISTSASSSHWYTSVGSIPTVTVSGTVGASGIDTFACSGDGITWQAWPTTDGGTVALTGLKDGTGTITCQMHAGSGLSATATLTLNLESAPPTVAFTTNASASTWYAAAGSVPSISTSATVGSSGLASYSCSGDGIGTQTFPTASGGSLDLTNVNQGSGTITCTVTSTAGLTASSTQTVKVDSAVPTIAWATTEVQSNWYSSTGSVPSLGATGATTGASGVDHITCSGAGLTGNVQLAGANVVVNTANLPNGTDSITCDAVSGAGVTSGTITRTILLDNSSPALVLSGTTQGTWYSSAQTVTADASADINPSGIQSISCAADGGSANVTNAATATQNVSGDGVHTVTCQPTSGAGVVGQSQSTKVRIDTQTPTVTQTIVPAPATAPPGTVEVQVTGAETNVLSGVASTSCSLDGQTATTVNGSQQTVAISTAGAHSLDCTTTTNAGVTSADSTQAYTVIADSAQFSLQYGTVPTAWQSGPVAVPVVLSGATAGSYQSLTCTVNSGTPITINGTSGSVTINATGTDKLDCYATAANGANTAAVQQLIRVDNQTPTATWSTSPTSTGENVTLLGSEATPMSGIASEACAVDGGAAQTASAASLTVTVTGNGTHQLACTMTTAAGVSANVTYTAHIAVPVPAPTTITAPDPGRWYRTAQSIVIGIPTTGPTIASVVCTQNGTSTTYPVSGTSVTIPVPAPGGTVGCYDLDATGAQSSAVTYQVNIDAQGPTGYFLQTGPTQAIVSATEPSNGAGVQTVTVQYQVAGGQWTTIAGTYNSATGQEVVTLPSSLQVPGVQYSLQATAVDNAGNSTVINTMKDGTSATSTVPNPDAGAAVTGGIYLGTVAPGTRGRMLTLKRTYKTETRVAHVDGRKVTHRVKVLVVRKRYVMAVNNAKLAQTLTVAYGQTVGLSGTLTLTSGNVGGQTITIAQQSGRAIKRFTATTSSAGVFNVKLTMNGSRTVTYTVDGVTRTAHIRERGSVRVAPKVGGSRLSIAFAGATGKVRYHVQRRRAGRWLAVGRAHTTNTHGRAVLKLPTALQGAAPSALRVVVTTQTAWEFLNLKERA